MNLRISDEIKVLERDAQVILLNRLNGLWIKIPKEIAEILFFANEKKLSLTQLEEIMHDEEDAELIRNVIIKLKSINFFEFQKEKDRVIGNISYSITHRCNLKCIHCMVDAKCGNQKDYFSTDEVLENLKIIIEAKPNSITITGGEPLLRKDFWIISEYLRRNYAGKIGLMTNGTLITQEAADNLVKYYDNFDISIDGVDEETCSIIRGKGVFNKIINAIKYLKKAGAEKISTSMVLSEDNSKYTKEYFELNKKLGTNPMLRAMSLYGRAKENKEILTTAQTDRKELKKEVINEKLVHRCCTCTAGYDQVVVEANGDIYPCNLFTEEKYRLGNIRKTKNIRALLGREGAFLSDEIIKYSPDKYEKCKDCDVSWFCWSCLYKIKELTEEEFKNRCAYQKKTLKAVWD